MFNEQLLKFGILIMLLSSTPSYSKGQYPYPNAISYHSKDVEDSKGEFLSASLVESYVQQIIEEISDFIWCTCTGNEIYITL